MKTNSKTTSLNPLSIGSAICISFEAVPVHSDVVCLVAINQAGDNNGMQLNKTSVSFKAWFQLE